MDDPFWIEKHGNWEALLASIHYYEFFAEKVQLAADRLQQSVELAADAALKNYPLLRAEALRTDHYHLEEEGGSPPLRR